MLSFEDIVKEVTVPCGTPSWADGLGGGRVGRADDEVALGADGGSVPSGSSVARG